ncbi:glycosyltransferase family 2 protein [Novosphingobium resinovorum]|uniref:glycosyltransferase family 2 protein n=1 Tax=Novosphingobium TaxID=165696 RepID=UPI001B3C501C|nr:MULTISPECIES: glycosyltransferase family 2 protein [Novosphingobium]MBF7012798.1 glycosyltransferase family 2 protein [Novosphingobium sp. HR1a]WJM27535.1 glycosyltransferase family 2 protein [Novosphingobium resinovorum]
MLATCFNRRETTLAALAALREAAAGLDYHVYLVDDGSTDGTGDAVRQNFPEVTVINGNGSLFWNGGMRTAWQTALGQGADYYLLFNDDLELSADSLAQLFNFQKEMEAAHGPKVISVGKVVDPDTSKVTYGGFTVVPGLSRLRFVRSPDNGKPCDTMNGNCVLIPAQAVAEVGILSEKYRHHTGDIDYGLRARNAGYQLFQSREPVGRTHFNHIAHAKVSTLTWANRKFIFTHPKGIPVGEWLHFCRSHGGWMWPVNFAVRYAKILRLRG